MIGKLVVSLAVIHTTSLQPQRKVPAMIASNDDIGTIKATRVSGCVAMSPVRENPHSTHFRAGSGCEKATGIDIHALCK